MITKSVLVQTLCVPCGNRCAHCLLAWDGQVTGADYDQSVRYAERFSEWIRANRPEISLDFYFGFAMDHPDMGRAVRDMQRISSSAGRYIQADGMRMRDEAQCDAYMRAAAGYGITMFNFTLYGMGEAHDRFAGRPGDYDLILRMMTAARRNGIPVSAGVVLTEQNARDSEQLDCLLDALSACTDNIRLWIPHEEGRGARLLLSSRLREETFDNLSPRARAMFNRRRYRPEREWVNCPDMRPTETGRMLLLSLTKDNIGCFEGMCFADTLAYLEKMDDDYYALFPSFDELCRMYGRADSTEMYEYRDLYRHYRMLYAQEHDLSFYDVTDERQCGSRRFGAV